MRRQVIHAQRQKTTTHSHHPESPQRTRSPISPLAMRTPLVQPKLTVNPPGDRYEQEADEMADQVMRMPEPKPTAESVTDPIQPLSIQRKCTECESQIQRQPEAAGNEILQNRSLTAVVQRQESSEEENKGEKVQAKEVGGQAPKVSSALETRLAASRNRGEPLPDKTQAFMESRFGQDFSSVRVHTNADAVQMNRELSAQAFTHGQDVFFGAGKYRPETVEGKRLLAHELAHVRQQSREPITSVSSIVQQKISFELGDAPIPTKEETKTLGLSEDEARVHLWLKKYQEEIAAAEASFGVDRRAIAGAIAWEALENVKIWSLRSCGPGKVHSWTWSTGLLGEGETVAGQVEREGYLPRVREKERCMILKTATGSIKYIGAIMSAFAEATEKPNSHGWPGENIRVRPEILTNAYQSEDLNSWRIRLETKIAGDNLKPGNEMAIWVRDHLGFLETAVGKPDISNLLSKSSTPLSFDFLKGAKFSESPDQFTLQPTTFKIVSPEKGDKRAKAAEQFVYKLKEIGTKYKQETNRNWEDYEISDCSKFIQWVLEKSGEGELFTRQNANTSAMRKIITELVDKKMVSFRTDNPVVGDIMMWSGHVGIVTEVIERNSKLYLVFAHMGSSGANLIGRTVNKKSEVIYWLKANDLSKIDEMGAGNFLGFWTPP
jgi:hypothetical protein